MWDAEVGDALVQAHVLGFNAVNPHYSSVSAEVILLLVSSCEKLQKLPMRKQACAAALAVPLMPAKIWLYLADIGMPKLVSSELVSRGSQPRAE